MRENTVRIWELEYSDWRVDVTENKDKLENLNASLFL